MDSFFTLPDDAREALEALEAELELPIRIVNVSAGRLPQWGALMQPTLDEYDGLTVVSWGIPATNHSWGAWEVTPEAWLDEPDDVDRYAVYMHDQVQRRVTLGPGEAQPLTDPWEPYAPLNENASFECVWTRDRAVCFGVQLDRLSGTYDDALSYERVLIEPLRMVAAADYIEQMRERRNTVMRERWANWAGDARTRVYGGVRQRVEAHERDYAQWHEHMMAAASRLREAQAELEALEARSRLTPDDLDALFEKLLAHPRITEVTFTPSNDLEIVTNSITLQHPAFGERTLGRFRITLMFGGGGDAHGDGARYGIRFFNLDHPRHGRPHPHISGQDGAACWGDVAATIEKYLVELRLIPLVEMLFMYLESFNPEDDYGRFASYWFDQEDAADVEADELATVGA